MSRVRVPFPALFYCKATYPSGLRERSAKPLFIGSNPIVASRIREVCNPAYGGTNPIVASRIREVCNPAYGGTNPIVASPLFLTIF
jgi:hypothetical protein